MRTTTAVVALWSLIAALILTTSEAPSTNPNHDDPTYGLKVVDDPTRHSGRTNQLETVGEQLPGPPADSTSSSAPSPSDFAAAAEAAAAVRASLVDDGSAAVWLEQLSAGSVTDAQAAPPTTGGTDATADSAGPAAEDPSVRFVANDGTAGSDVDFAVLADRYAAVLSSETVALVPPGPADGSTGGAFDPVTMSVVGAAPEAAGEMTSAAVVDPSPGAGDRPAVSFADALPGVDVVYSPSDGDLAYNFVLDPGVDPAAIALSFGGTSGLDLLPDGALTIDATTGPDYISTAPYSYQEIDGQLIEVSSAYVIRPNGAVGFELGPYDSTKALIIDPTFQSAATVGGLYGSGTTIDVPVPSGTASGDLLIAQIAYNAVGAGIITPPAGWTEISTTGGNGITQALYWRLATASEPPSYGFTLSSGATDTAAGAMTRYDGVDTITPIDASAGQTNAPAAAVTAPSLTTSVADATLVAFFAVRDDGNGTSPAGMVERTDVNSAQGGAPADETLAFAADEQLAGAGATGDRTATVDASGGSVGILIALTPAPPPACPAGDVDGDGLSDCEEDANSDADNDPATSPGPDSDGDGTVDYLDSDDDGDGTPTSAESADPNGDGDPRDALDSDRDGQPDYLDPATGAASTDITSEQKISNTSGGLVATLNSGDGFGVAVAAIGDVDRDGITDLLVGVHEADDGGPNRGAAYVLFLNADGTVKAEQKISDTAGGLAATLDDEDRFGHGVARLGDIDGDGTPDVAVGAYRDGDGGADRGAVYVLFLNADGTVKAEQKISDTVGGLAATLDDGDRFGVQLSGLGDVDGDGINDLAVGADNDADGGFDRGAVYVLFLNADGTVKGEQKISDTVGGLAATLDDTDDFGRDLAGTGDIDGDNVPDLAVGVYDDDDGGSGRGAVYVLFLNADGTVKGEQKISDTAGGFGPALHDFDHFGVGLGPAGDIDADGTPDLLIGAYGDDAGQSDRGAAHIVLLNSDGTVKSARVIDSNSVDFTGPLDGDDRFGASLAGLGDLDGDGAIDLVVGARTDADGAAGAGAVYVLNLAYDFCANDSDGDGLHDCFEDGNTDFDGDPSTSPGPDSDGDGTADYLDSDDDGDGVATSLEGADLNGDGDPRDGRDSDLDGDPDYLDGLVVPSGLPAAGELKVSDSVGGLVVDLLGSDYFGSGVAGVGDLDGDGVGDVVVGALYDDGAWLDTGAVYVLFLNSDGSVKGEQEISSGVGGFVESLDQSDYFGSSVGVVGDLDGDGRPEVVVGAQGRDDGPDAAGAVYVLFLDTDGTVRNQQKISNVDGGLVENLQILDYFGSAVDGVGDVDGDGVPDLVVGAVYDDDGGQDAGAVYVLFLNADGSVKGEQKISDTSGGLLVDLEASDYFGQSVSGLGDIDGDGVPDVLVGAFGDDDGGTDRGAAYVLLLNSDGSVKAEQKLSELAGGLGSGLENNDYFGWSASGVGDLDGDGVGDVVIGAPHDNGGGNDRGSVYLIHLNSDGSVKGQHRVADYGGGVTAGLGNFDYFGYSVGTVGDLDGDGSISLVVGATGDDDGGGAAGAVYFLELGTTCQGAADSDGDGLHDCFEDGNTDFDGDPSTSPGPDSDGDGTADYLDSDDDGDGVATSLEGADLNGDGDPRDGRDSDLDGDPDYLDGLVVPSGLPAAGELKVSDSVGGLVVDLLGSDYFGSGVAGVGDLDGDGVGDVVVGALYDDGAWLDTGAVYVLFLNSDGSVKGEQEISSGVGGFVESLDQSDYFGSSVGVVGDLDGDGRPEVVVGAQGRDDGPDAAGAVYVLFLDTDGTVRNQQKISNVDGGLVENLQILDYFGSAVDGVGDVDGDGVPDLVVGAVYDDDGGQDAGAVYVLFLNADGSVKGEQKISDTSGGLLVDLEASDYFGQSVSGLGDIDGDGVPDVLVGAFGDDDGGTDRGAAYVLLLNSDGSVKAEQKLSELAGGLGSGLENNDYFGWSASGVGDLDGDGVGDVVIGAPHDNGGGNDRGSVYLIHLNSDGSVKGQHRVADYGGGVTAGLGNFDYFGYSVGTVGDLDGDGSISLVVGATGDDDGGGAAGAVYFLELGTTCQGAADSDGDGLHDCFEDGNTDFDGDPSTSPGPDTDADTTVNYLDADDDGDGTATSLENADLNGDGDPRDALDSDLDGQPDYLDGPIGGAELPVTAEQKVSDSVGGLVVDLLGSDYFGSGVAGVGDLDGDGVGDVVVGALYDDGAWLDTGAVYVLFLNSDGSVKGEQEISSGVGGFVESLDQSDYFGSSVGVVGDLDGDGRPEVVVGAQGRDDGPDAAGAVYVLFLDTDGTVRNQQKISNVDGGLVENLQILDYFGSAVDGVGDVDGDGVPDLVVGAVYDDDGGQDAGAVYVLFLNADGSVKGEQKISDTSGGLLVDLEASDYFGQSVSGLGDIDGDGVPDVLVGAFGDDDGGTDRGAAYVLLLNSDGSVKAEQKLSELAGGLGSGLENNDYFGWSASGVGDLDGDGVGDVVIGAPHDDDGGNNRGAAYLIHLNSDGTAKNTQKISDDTGGFTTTLGNFDYFGYSVGTVGDLNGDGSISLVVGAPGDDDGGGAAGALYFLELTGICPPGDADSDGLQDCYETGDTDGDGTANYLDDDDDGDGTLTSAENADPNGDGHPRDAVDTDRDGQPDYLDIEAGPSSTPIADEQKISDTAGGLSGPLANQDYLGWAVASIGDLDGDGIVDMLASAHYDDDGGSNRGAVYVLFLNADGTVKAEQKISDTAGGFTGVLDDTDTFGVRVAVLGDIDGDGVPDVAVGASLDDDGAASSGAVYILFMNTDGTVKAEQKISATSGGFTGLLTGGQLGAVTSVGDLDGDGVNDIAVGAYSTPDGGTYRGAAYVLFLNADGTVKAEQRISGTAGGLAATLDDGDSFGYHVAGTGDIDGDGTPDLAVGAYRDDDGGTDRGAVYVLFLNADGTVRDEQKISDTAGGFGATLDDSDEFGAVAAIGDIDADGVPDIAVGASGDDDGGSSRGAVYLLALNADGTVKSEQKISSTEGGLLGPLTNYDRFGESVAGLGDLDGDGALNLSVGASFDSDGGPNRGAVYILDLTEPCVTDTDSDGLCDANEDANTDGDNDPATNSGPDTDGDTTANYLDNDDDGDGTLTSAENADPNGDSDPRDAVDTDRDGQPDYLDPDAVGTSTIPVIEEQRISDTVGGFATALGADDNFGRSVVGIGDLDGDGVDDLAVGAPRDDDGGNDRGAVYVLFLNADGTVKGEQKISDTQGSLATDLHDTGYFGWAVGSLGDLDGDGHGDIVVGARTDDGAGTDHGAAYVLFLNADGTVKAEQEISSAGGGLAATLETGDNFGSAVTGLGDLNGDGVNDLVVGAEGDDDGGTGRGAVYVLLLNVDGTVKAEQKISDTAGGLAAVLDDSDKFGWSVGTPGDLDGDGVTDLAVGVRYDDDGGTNRGAVHVLFLNTDGTVKSEQKVSSTAGGLTETIDDADFLGSGVAGLGDIDGDGVADLLVGAYGDDDGASSNGAVYLWNMNSDGTVKASAKISSTEGGLTGPLSGSPAFGAAVAGLGDLDGDGGLNLVVGAYANDDGGSNRGAIYVLDLAVPGNVVTVNSTADSVDNDPGNGICWTGSTTAAGTPECTLRAAIEEANGSTLVDAVEFDIPAADANHNAGTWTITPASSYPAVSETVTIDGTTQAGVAAATNSFPDPVNSSLAIGLSGSSLGASSTMLALSSGSDGSVIRGLAFTGHTASDADTIEITNSSNNVIAGNHFGGDPTGLIEAANRTGIHVIGASTGNRIGGVVAADRNLFVEQTYAAIAVRTTGTTGTVIQGNDIGYRSDGSPATVVASFGVITWDGATGTMIGGTGPGAGNRIRGSTRGVTLDANSAASFATILGNHITDNVWHGIDLLNDGTTANDAGDADAGPNDLLNYPVITAAEELAGTVSVDIDLDVPAGDYRIELFTNASGPGPFGYGEGETFVHGWTVTHTGSGVESFSTSYSGSAGLPLSATTTQDLGGGSYGATSEFSGSVDTCADPDGDGLCSHYETVYGDTDGDTVNNPDDSDDDGDGTPTSAENADPNSDGNPRDGLDADFDGQPDYLDVPTLTVAAAVASEQKISATSGGFSGTLGSSDLFGHSVTPVGDLDGDGIVDVAVGAYLDDDGGSSRGAVYVLFLNADGTVKAEQKISDTAGGGPSLDDTDQFGRNLAAVGDLNGDGRAELAVGAFRDDDGGSNRGAVYILFLNADGTAAGHQKISSTSGGLGASLSNGVEFGRGLTGLGDVDGDGIPDLAVGASQTNDGGPDRGAVHILFLNTDGTVKADQKISATSGGLTATIDDDDELGVGLAGIGDLDNDGVRDLAVAASKDDDGAPDAGALHVLFLNPDGTVKAEQKISATVGGFTGDLDGADSFGSAIAAVGDLDNDGVVDLAVGAPGDDDGSGSAGAIHLLFLNSNGTVKSDEKISATSGGFTGPLDGFDSFGSGVAGLGDLDGDGTISLVVGAHGDDDGASSAGAVYVLELGLKETVTVNSTGDATDNNPGDDHCQTGGSNADGNPECTLRAALAEAAASTQIDNVEFNIPTGDAGYRAAPVAHWVIAPTGSAFPQTADLAIIDGTTQPGWTDQPIIQLDGTSFIANEDGIDAGAGMEVRALSITGWPGAGLKIDQNGVTIGGSWLGIAPDGTVQPNRREVIIHGSATGVTVGGPTYADRNLLSGAGTGNAVQVNDTATNTRFENNHFGLAPDGITSTGAANDIVVLNNSSTGTVITDNHFAFSGAGGLVHAGTGTVTVTGNVFGETTAGGPASIDVPIRITQSGPITIGGTGAGDGNTITNASGDAIRLESAAATATILGNSITDNTGLGIDFNNDGVTANDAGDGDSGPNDLLNFPVTTSSGRVASTISVDYDLDVPAGDYRVEFFGNDAANPSGNGEGQTLLGSQSVTHTGSGVEAFSTTLTSADDTILTATVTQDLGGGSYGVTSEFSAAVTVACTDSDGDGLCDDQEDNNIDGDDDPATDPTDTDGDGTADYLDLDDDDDGTPTGAELADPNGDGDPRDALDSDRDGQPDYLDHPSATSTPRVATEQKISATFGGLTGPLADGDRFGSASTPVGDIDGDGIVDLAVGAPDGDDGGANRGAVYVLLLNADGTVKAEQKISSTTGGLVGPLDDQDGFGAAVAGVGDLDGDGVGDLLVGAPGDDDGGAEAGAAYLLFLHRDGQVKAQQKISASAGGLTGPLAGADRFGAAVGGLGDINADGVVDVMIGAPGRDDGGPGRGAAYVLLLNPDGTVGAEQAISSTLGGLTGPLGDDDQFGSTIATVGDLNQDGRNEVAVAAPTDDDGGTDRGAVYVLFLDGLGSVSAEQKISSTTGGSVGLADGDRFGSGLAGVGDLDADGIGDLVVGADGTDDGGSDRGAIHLLLLNADGTVAESDRISATAGGLSGPLDDLDRLGSSVAGLGDLDLDGTTDLAIGAPSDDDGGTDRGAVYVIDLAPPVTVDDSSIRRSDLTVAGGADPAPQTGVVGDGSGFGGGNDRYVAPATDIASTEWSLSGWVNATSFGTDPRVAAKTTADGDTIYELLVDDASATAGQAMARLRLGATTHTVSGGSLGTGAWHHLAADWDGATLSLYVDGALVDSTPASGSVASDLSLPFTVGNLANADRGFNGRVDEIRLGHRALGADRVAFEYANVTVPAAVVTVGAEQSEMVSPWTIDGTETRSGVGAARAPQLTTGTADAWMTATGVDEPGVEFTSWWWVSTDTGIDLAAGTRTGSPTNQYETGLSSPTGWDLASHVSGTRTQQGAPAGTTNSGNWVGVTIRTDENGNSSVAIDGTEVIAPTAQGATLLSGSIGLRAGLLPAGQSWFVDDARARKYLSVEPTATLGPLERG